MTNGLPLNVPFLVDDDYVDFLVENEAGLQAVHFGLYDPLLQDARIQLEQRSLDSLKESLCRLMKPKKYLLANGRFHPASVYDRGGGLGLLVAKLEALVSAKQLDGLIFSDSYMVTALGDFAPSLVESIEAIPSVNFQLDSTAKLAALLELIRSAGFRMPGKITLDRSLSRNLAELTELKRALARRWPGITVELLANEGCLPHCPFRATHEALISLANCRLERMDTRKLNDDLACVRHLNTAPYRILSSPFIRPEDMVWYKDKTDVIKICGRTLGPEFLKRTIAAYLAGSCSGNLLDLLDASHWMSDFWNLPNPSLPDDFLEKIIHCKLDCSTCSYCKELFERIAEIKPFELVDRRKV